jgi:predicted secreted protein
MVTRIDASADGETVTIAPGALVELDLPENAGTGYRWALDQLPPGSEVVEDRVEPNASTPGARAMHVFVVRADQPGTLSANLRREWEATPIDTFSVHLTAA